MAKRLLFFLLFISLGFSLRCSQNGESECGFGIDSVAPEVTNLKISTNQKVTFSITPRICSDEWVVKYSWSLDEKPLSLTGDNYTFFACSSDVGAHVITAKIVSNEEEYSHSWDITVTSGGFIERPPEVSEAVRKIKEGGSFGYDEEVTAENREKFIGAKGVLDDYLVGGSCDMEANYAAGLAGLILLADSAEEVFLRHAEMSVDDVKSIVDGVINHILPYYLAIKEKADKEFSFEVKFLSMLVFHNDPVLDIGDIQVFLDGEHDLGEVYLIVMVLEVARAYLEIGLAFNGLIDHILKIENDISIDREQKRLIEKLETDPDFLALTDDGPRLLLKAQERIVRSLRSFNEVVDIILAETDNQDNDLVRYWDCGEDAICPGDPREIPPGYDDCGEGVPYKDLNLNAKCNLEWEQYDSDPGEGNLQFDSGEPVGTEKVRIGTSEERLTLPISQLVRDSVELFARNIEGPDPLNFDEILGLPEGIIEIILDGFGIPYPEIRSSEFFVNPTALRDILPLYDKIEKEFIIVTESEPYEDTGLDHLFSPREPGFDPHTKQDPNHDDLNLSCTGTRACNAEDGYDNDYDGLIDGLDTDRGLNADLGLERNLGFDYVELCGKNGYDVNDSPCLVQLNDGRQMALYEFEPFEDIGIGTESLGMGDGVFTMGDIDHAYPRGEHVGGPAITITLDPKNGTNRDEKGELIDLYYVFLPDPTFSRALIFPEAITNIEGNPLTENAKVHRFVWKAWMVVGDLLDMVVAAGGSDVGEFMYFDEDYFFFDFY